MKQTDADILYQYVRDIIFGDNRSLLSEEELPAECGKLVRELNQLHIWLKESSEFAGDIATGRLNSESPSENNPFSEPLQQLRSNLSHLVWQTKQVANGDYSQKVAMLGEFSEAFNTMTEQLRQRENALLEQNTLLSYITDNIGELVIVIDDETNEVLYENRAVIDLTMKEPKTAEVLYRYIEKYRSINESRSQDVNFCQSDGLGQKVCYHIDSFHIDWQGRQSTAHLLRNITEQKAWESSIEYAANSDQMTGLYNRRYCMKVLESYVAEKISFSVCFADLDRLKYVNDNFGHAFGDEYIKLAARILKESFRDEDVICRFGGDEFVVLLKGCDDKCMDVRMKQVRKRLEQYASENKREYRMSISYGIINCNKDNKLSAEEILNQSDEKMYRFKQLHRE